MSGKCLIIESDDGWVDFLERNLASLSLDTKVVRRYEDALTELRSGTYDLVTLDLSLDPEKRSDWGKTLLATIKSQGLSVPPIIVVSGTTQVEDFADCINDYRDHVFYFARKTVPFQPLNFINAVNGILNSSKGFKTREAIVSVGSVCEILRRVPAGLRRWTWENKSRTGPTKPARNWHIDNEYHVQNLLWFLLSPLFPDLKDEESTPGVGPLQPRADICIPQLQLVIEVKFWRSHIRHRQLIEEIAADASLYLTVDSPYKSIIGFVWDEAARTEEHDYIVKGLKGVNGIIDVVVVSRPGAMNSNQSGST